MPSTDYSCNELVEKLGKPSHSFTKADLERFIRENGVRHVNFMYPGGDGRLKTLNFVINDAEYLDEILTCGERVDSSSLFSHVEASSSDLYVVPRFSTAFLDPFAELSTLCLLCSFFDKDGNPLASSPEYTLRKACSVFREETGLDLTGCEIRLIDSYSNVDLKRGDNYFVDIYHVWADFEEADVRIESSEATAYALVPMEKITELSRESRFLHYERIVHALSLM